MKLNNKSVSNKLIKFNFTTFFFIAVSIISTTLAWFAIGNSVSTQLQASVATWVCRLHDNNDVDINDIGIEVANFKAGSADTTKTINISNEGTTASELKFEITYLRIFNQVFDVSNQTNLLDSLSQDYPFRINFYLKNNFVGGGDDTVFQYNISWPLDSGDDDSDTIWGRYAYNFNKEEEASQHSNNTYQIRNAIEIHIKLSCEKDRENTGIKHTLGETKLINTTNGSNCSSLSSTCLTHTLIDYTDYSTTYMVVPTQSVSSIKANQISSQSTTSVTLDDILNSIKTDILATNITNSNYSDIRLGNASKGEYSTMKSRILSHSSRVTFSRGTFDYLKSDTCYWLNTTYDSTHTFAIKNKDSNTIEIYPELNTNSCKFISTKSYYETSRVVTLFTSDGVIPSSNGWESSGSSATKTVNFNSQFGTLPTPTRTGYTFAGWYTLNEGGSVVNSSTTLSYTSSGILYAHWTGNNVTVSYNASSGSVSPSSNTQVMGNYYTNLPTPTRTNYNFLGWYTSSSGGNLVDSNTKVTNNVAHTLYARWESKATIVSVYLDSNGGTLTSGNSLYNIISSKALDNVIDFSIRSGATPVTNGVYKTTKTESGTTVYYYRGKVDNHVIFNNMCWRIVRTTETGGVKLIYNGIPSSGQCTATTGTSTQIGTSKFNPSDNKNAYVGYMYGTAGSSTYAAEHANTNNSTIKTYIDNWYSTNFTASSVTSKIEDTIYCNDRSTVSYDSTKINASWASSYGTLGYGANGTLYGAINRASYQTINPSPSLVCPQTNDKFTVSSSKGNGKLTYPVGLITLDEAVFAGFNTYASNTSNYKDTNSYLYTGQNYWTFSPVDFDSTNGLAGVGRVNGTGYFYDYYVSNSYGVRPVISLKTGVTVTGSGTSSSPYTVSGISTGSIGTSKTVTYGSTYGTLSSPTRTNYTFNGWYTQDQGGTLVNSSSVVSNTENHTLYAHWTGNNVTVTYNSVGGSVTPSSGTQVYGNKYINLPIPIKAGYTFAGWFTAQTGGTQVTTSTQVTNASAHTLYAHWIGNIVTVTYNANGGSVGSGVGSQTVGNNYANLPTPVNGSMIFLGWYTEQTGGTQVTTSTTVAYPSSQTLWAHWTISS